MKAYIRPATDRTPVQFSEDNNHLKTTINTMEHGMLSAVLAASTLFMFAAATGNSTADPCAATLPAVVINGEGNDCPTSGIIEIVKENISTLLQEVVRCKLPGSTPQHPASSCAEIMGLQPNSPSGHYYILNSTGSPVQVFCEMGDVFPANLNVTGSWVRIAHLNMTDPDQQCPENFRLHTHALRVCGKISLTAGCDSVTFTAYGVQYKQVCGRVRGYQLKTPDGFLAMFDYCEHINCTTIDEPYVDGISITHGNTPRNHIWTYAVGLFEDPGANVIRESCPCTGGTAPPSFVGSDYYCESALYSGPWTSVVYSDDPLWDGQDCDGAEATCCDPPNLPWFCKELPEPTTDDLEVRICTDQGFSDEDEQIDLLELYIQ